jgi:hypothetical protein
MPQEFTQQNIQGNVIKPITPMSYEFGGMTGIEQVLLFPDGCIDYLPENENQSGIYFDTYGCVSFSFLNAIETLFTRLVSLGKISLDNIKWLNANYLVNGKLNFSDRDLVVMSGTNPNVGNDGWTVFTTAKNKGLICESDAPWDFRERDPKINNKENYYNYTRSDKNEKKAQEFLKRFDIQAEWVNKDNLLESSKYGAVQVYVNAWYLRDGKYYNPNPGKSNHAVELAKKSENKIFDQYDPFIKQLESDNDFYSNALKINIIEKTMAKPIIQNNTLIMMVTGGGNIGMYLDGNIIVDEPAKLLTVWLARSSKNGAFTGGLVKSLTQADWDLFPKTNLKGELL